MKIRIRNGQNDQFQFLKNWNRPQEWPKSKNLQIANFAKIAKNDQKIDQKWSILDQKKTNTQSVLIDQVRLSVSLFKK